MNHISSSTTAGSGGAEAVSLPKIVPAAERGPFLARFVFAFVVTSLFLNPYVERLQYSNSIAFMFSHYALFSAGFALSFRTIRISPWFAVPAAVISVLWHFPLPFAASAALPPYRYLEEGTLVLSGFLVGASLDRMLPKLRSLMLVLWFTADTALSILFIVLPEPYSSVSLRLSPYPASQLILLGVLMIFFMNGVIAFVVYRYVRRFRSVILSEEL